MGQIARAINLFESPNIHASNCMLELVTTINACQNNLTELARTSGIKEDQENQPGVVVYSLAFEDQQHHLGIVARPSYGSLRAHPPATQGCVPLYMGATQYVPENITAAVNFFIESNARSEVPIPESHRLFLSTMVTHIMYLEKKPEIYYTGIAFIPEDPTPAQ